MSDDRFLTLAREIHLAMAWGKNHEGEWPPVNCDGCAAIARALQAAATQARNDGIEAAAAYLVEMFGGSSHAVHDADQIRRALRREGKK